MDVDGVLTDGRIYYVPRAQGGLLETKTFHSRDGLAQVIRAAKLPPFTEIPYTRG